MNKLKISILYLAAITLVGSIGVILSYRLGSTPLCLFGIVFVASLFIGLLAGLFHSALGAIIDYSKMYGLIVTILLTNILFFEVGISKNLPITEMSRITTLFMLLSIIILSWISFKREKK